MDRHVVDAYDVGGRLGPPRGELWCPLQGDERLRAEAGQRPGDGVGVAVVVEALCCARRIEGDHVAGTDDEAGTQVRPTLVRDLAHLDLRAGGGAYTRLAVVKGEGGDEDQLLDCRMESRLGDDGSPVRVSDEHHVTVELVKRLTHTGDIGVQVAQWTTVLPMPGQV